MAFTQQQIEYLVGIVRQQFPDWQGFSHAGFQAEEVEYKQKTVAKAQELLSPPEIARLLEESRWDEFIERLEKVGKGNNLLFVRMPDSSDLNILYHPKLDKPGYCREFGALLLDRKNGFARLERYLDYVAQQGLPNKWTFPTYFLFMCHPETEIFVKPVAVTKPFLKLIGSDFILPDKPTVQAYATVRHLCQELREAMSRYGPRDMVDIQSLMWVCAKATGQHSFNLGDENEEEDEMEVAERRRVVETSSIPPITGQTSFWKISPGADAWQWDECLSYGFIAVGWPEFGDLTNTTRAEFEAQCAQVMAQNPRRKRAGLEQLWRFRNIKRGDRIVANRGTTEVLGIGVVEREYEYDPIHTYRHRLAVRWYDTTPRRVNQPGWKRTLVELSRERFELLAGAPSLDSPISSTAFTGNTFDLLARLHQTPTREFYRTIEEPCKQHVEEPLQQLLRGVAARLPPAMRSVLETDRKLFGRFLKNDFGQGGVWDFYWGALYPKGGTRIADAQLFIWINHEGLHFGFALGSPQSAQHHRFVDACRQHQSILIDLLRDCLQQEFLVFGRDAEGQPSQNNAEETPSWDEWLREPERYGVRAASFLSHEDALNLSAEDLQQQVLQTFEAVFPLVLLAAAPQPVLEIRNFIDNPNLELVSMPEPGDTGTDELDSDELDSDEADTTAPDGAAFIPTPPVVPPVIQPIVTLADLALETHFEEALLGRWARAIERKKQAVLYGPPGTGKTHIARALARHLMSGSDGFAELVQFHPAYSYEDFMQGIRPQSDKNGRVSYPLLPGRFLDFCRQARGRDGTCVLIIDEINRADLARVFGELMFLLEYREEQVPLAGGGLFEIPANVRIIGTMNTADRSIALVDHALRRRFAFLEVAPQYDVLARRHAGSGYSTERLIALLKQVNAAINDNHYLLGISYFLGANLDASLEDIWTMEIEPYLEEFFFDKPATVEQFRWSRIGQGLLPPVVAASEPIVENDRNAENASSDDLAAEAEFGTSAPAGDNEAGEIMGTATIER